MKLKLLLSLIFFSGLSLQSRAQDADSLQQDLYLKARSAKTLAGWEVLSNLYQVAVDNVSGDDKGLTFKGTIFGIRSIFNSDLKKDFNYRRLKFQRRFEPVVNYLYTGRFKRSTLSTGFSYALVNDNDPSASPLLNDKSAVLIALAKENNEADETIVTALREAHVKSLAKYPTEDINGRAKETQQFKDRLKMLNDFEESGDTTKLDEEMKQMLTSQSLRISGKEYTALEYYKSRGNGSNLFAFVEKTAGEISRKWNWTVTPKVTYQLVDGKFQGFNITSKVIKGFLLSKDSKKASQFLFTSSYNIGDDTVVTSINTKRRFLSGKAGFNQVLALREIKASGEASPTKVSCFELAIEGGYDHILNGLTIDEKRGQPTLSAKLGLLIGKETWLTVPFTYNFERKQSQALISLKANIGEAPFSK